MGYWISLDFNMVARFADNFVDAITEAMVPEVRTVRKSPESVLRDLQASTEITRRARRQAIDLLLDARRPALSETQVKVAVRRAMREVGVRDE